MNLGEEKEDNKGKEKSLSNPKSKKLSGSFTYKVAFKREWKDLYLVKEALTDKYKFYCIMSCEKSLTHHHGGLNDIKKLFNWPAHHAEWINGKSRKNFPTFQHINSCVHVNNKSFEQKYLCLIFCFNATSRLQLQTIWDTYLEMFFETLKLHQRIVQEELKLQQYSIIMSIS